MVERSPTATRPGEKGEKSRPGEKGEKAEKKEIVGCNRCASTLSGSTETPDDEVGS